MKSWRTNEVDVWQVKGRTEAEIKKIIIEVCCGEESKLASHFEEREEESLKLDLTKHNVSKDYTVEALNRPSSAYKRKVVKWSIWKNLENVEEAALKKEATTKEPPKIPQKKW